MEEVAEVATFIPVVSIAVFAEAEAAIVMVEQMWRASCLSKDDRGVFTIPSETVLKSQSATPKASASTSLAQSEAIVSVNRMGLVEYTPATDRLVARAMFNGVDPVLAALNKPARA